jgi:2-phosphosulfolactate phosphatase
LQPAFGMIPKSNKIFAAVWMSTECHYWRGYAPHWLETQAAFDMADPPGDTSGMTVDVLILPKEIDPARLASRTAVVFDVLRATTSITAALAAGVKEVRVFGDLESTLAAAGEFTGPKITCGERHTLPPPGFDLGNSPGQFDRAKHAGVTVFMSTTNGTRAIVASRGAKLLLCGALVNASAVARRVMAAGNDATMVCSGSDGAPSFEDLLGTGAVINAMKKIADVTTEGDLALVASRLAAAVTNLPAALAETYGGHNIRRVHLDGDIAFAGRADVFDIVGRVVDGPLRVMSADDVGK